MCSRPAIESAFAFAASPARNRGEFEENPIEEERYAMLPHSVSLTCSQRSETGLVRKSLHPAASAFTRSACSDEAVRATMMTGMANCGEVGLESGNVEEAEEAAEVEASSGKVEFGDAAGVVMNVPMLLSRSIARISLVASIPSLTGS